jgi:hypothetical protein
MSCLFRDVEVEHAKWEARIRDKAVAPRRPVVRAKAVNLRRPVVAKLHSRQDNPDYTLRLVWVNPAAPSKIKPIGKKG